MMNAPTVRIARPTRNIAPLVKFYRDGLGYDIIASFEDHDGFDGIMFGMRGEAYHLEFTRYRQATHSVMTDPEDMLVLYLPDRAIWSAAVDRMRSAGFAPVRSFNPYWDRMGLSFEDPDGRRIVLQNTAWPPAPAGPDSK